MSNNILQEFFKNLADTLRYKRQEGEEVLYKPIEMSDKIEKIDPNLSGYFTSDSRLSIKSGIQGITDLIITQDVETIESYAYGSCSNLENITFLGGKIISSYAFSHCSKLDKIDLPDGLTTIGNSAFEGCRNLEEVTFPDTLTGVGLSAFYNTKWYDNYADKVVYAGTGNVYAYKGSKSELETLELTGIKSITQSSFDGFTELTSVHIESDTNIGCYLGAYSFRNCSKLQTVYISNLRSFNTGVFIGTSISEYYFMNQVSIPKFIEGVFPKIGDDVTIYVHPQMYDTWMADNLWNRFNIVKYGS